MNPQDSLILRTFRTVIAIFMTIGAVVPAAAQKPLIFNVSNVVIGAQRIGTAYFLATGKWSDDSADAGLSSTEIHCYKRLGFCEVAGAYPGNNVGLTEFDILRWDSQEMVAEDNSAICVVGILRADFIRKRVTMSSADKGVNKDPFCAGSNRVPTAVLLGSADSMKGPNKNQRK
jgi:hypothetical protein